MGVKTGLSAGLELNESLKWGGVDSAEEGVCESQVKDQSLSGGCVLIRPGEGSEP